MATMSDVAQLAGVSESTVSHLINETRTIERVQGFRAAIDLALEHSGGSFSGPARIATHELLAMPNRPTAIVSGSNLMTMGVMRALSEAGSACRKTWRS